MYTSVALLALSGFLAAASPSPAAEDPSWLTDYSAARKQGNREHKPLAVFLGKGGAGWRQVSRDGQLGKEARRLLADEYVCVYVDTSKRAGRELADAFEMADGVGIVLSDRTGDLQAFRHEGDLPAGRMAEYLRRYADPDLVVRTTERNDGDRVSYYPAEPPPVVYAPVPYAPPVMAPMSYGGFGSFGGGGRSC